MYDAFPSSSLSLILAWVCSIPLILTAVTGGVGLFFERVDRSIPRWFVIWLFLCILALSPLRYILLQGIMASAYPVQSVRAFISTFLLALYVPIVFGALYFVGVVLPLIATLRVAFGDPTSPRLTRSRLALGTALAPVNAVGGYLAFFWLLQYAGWTVHWLGTKDVIGSTNGPATAVYKLIEPVTPLPLAGWYTTVTATSTDMLRNHVASFYLGDRREAEYMHDAYPALYESLTKAEPSR